MSWIKNLSVVVVSVMISLLALELGLRTIYPDKVGILTIRDHSDPLLPRHIAGSHVDLRRNTVVSFDSNGMRVNPNKCLDETANFKMLIVGDSNIAGMFLDDSETLGARISDQSARLGTCITVDTFGVSGFGPDQTAFAIERITQEMNYDYVVFHIFADNDAGDLVRNNYYANAELLNDGYCYVDKPVLEDLLIYKATRKLLFILGLQQFGYGKALPSNADIDCLIVSHSSGTFAQVSHERALADWAGNRSGGRQIYMDDRYDIEFACETNEEALLYVTEAFSQVRDMMRIISDERGFNTLYLIQPSEDDVTDNHPERQDKGCSAYDPRNLSRFYSELLVNEKTIDLYRSFHNCSECYFSEVELGVDNHWSPYGVNRAASELTDFVLSHASQ